jgi:cell division protein ZapA
MNGGDILVKENIGIAKQTEVKANITIAERIYRMKVAVEEEGYIRKAEKLVKSELDKYNRFTTPDIQDKLSVALLNIAVQLVKTQRLSTDKPLRSEVENIDRELGVYLEKQGSLDDIE